MKCPDIGDIGDTGDTGLRSYVSLHQFLDVIQVGEFTSGLPWPGLKTKKGCYHHFRVSCCQAPALLCECACGY